MSYEGYETYKCQLGHEHHYDCYDTPDKETWRCPGEPECERCGMPAKECGAMLGVYEVVDQTNGHCSLGWRQYAGADAPIVASVGEQMGMKIMKRSTGEVIKHMMENGFTEPPLPLQEGDDRIEWEITLKAVCTERELEQRDQELRGEQ